MHHMQLNVVCFLLFPDQLRLSQQAGGGKNVRAKYPRVAACQGGVDVSTVHSIPAGSTPAAVRSQLLSPVPRTLLRDRVSALRVQPTAFSVDGATPSGPAAVSGRSQLPPRGGGPRRRGGQLPR